MLILAASRLVSAVELFQCFTACLWLPLPLPLPPTATATATTTITT